MKISEEFDEYEKIEVVGAGLSPRTLNSYENAKKLAVSFFSDVEIFRISPLDIQEFYCHLMGWQSPDTARGNLICLRAVIRRAYRKGRTLIDLDDIKIPKREKREVEYLTKEEVERFIEIIATPRRGYPKINRLRNVAIVELLWCSGIRVGELCKLNRNSIKNHCFTVVGKSKNPRVCFVNEQAASAINSYLEERNDNDPALFISNQNLKRITPGGVRRVFQFACEKSEFERVHPHTIRHSFATYMLSREVDLRYIGEMMGHESLDTTKIYTHLVNPKMQKIFENAWA